ncbi:hypothetical protein VTJ49DRAFT_3961 [Mycothermus thermophilus]|uniref:RRM domain-containing protein n=1 Tax=Humicola insolens TaxID=85995 RepID=A0ABR3V6J0_HUMIN
MSAMLRANKSAGGRGRLPRHARSVSLNSESSRSGSDSETTGARLSAATSPRTRFGNITNQFDNMTLSDSGNSGGTAPFQLGATPDDVFAASGSEGTASTHSTRSTSARGGSNNTGSDADGPGIETHNGDIVVAGQPNNANMAAAGIRANYGGMALQRRAPMGEGVGAIGVRRADVAARADIHGLDAQNFYPPTACVFVANLPEAAEDRALEAAVTREFSRFGTVFVKIRREGRGHHIGMPYAFAQFTNNEDARTAMEQGRGIMILGRPCRTEMVRANRTYIIYGRGDEDITIEEARRIFESYGPLSRCEPLPAQLCAAMGLPFTVLAEFQNFDAHRDLNSAVRRNDRFRIDAFDVQNHTVIARPNPDEVFLQRYDVDRRSVFVGGLPLDTTREELIELFSQVGEVVDANVITRENYANNRIRAFGFVEFARATTPGIAIQRLHNTDFRDGTVLNVERKSIRNASTPRRVRSQAFQNGPAPRTPVRMGFFQDAAPVAPGSGGARFGGGFGTPTGHGPAPVGHTPHGLPALGFHSTPGGPGPMPSPLGPGPSPLGPGPSPLGHGTPQVPGAPQAPLIGASGLPVTPGPAHSFGPSPFAWAGGYWPGWTIAQDPATGHAFWTFTPPAAGNGNGNGPEAPPTPRGHGNRQANNGNGGNGAAPAPTPTRPRGRD